ncbi:MAG: VanZ family protein [Melioribacteraceae bacterium]|nr:VanZ family protein [Melioribacteraceae bacterium]
MYNFIKNHKVKLVYIPLGIYWVILFALTTLPSKSLPSVAFSDKIKHFLAYFILTILLKLTLHFQEKYNLTLKMCTVITLGIIAFYGMADEIHQYFIPGRYCEFYDWVANIAGGIVGVLLVRFFIVKNDENIIKVV